MMEQERSSNRGLLITIFIFTIINFVLFAGIFLVVAFKSTDEGQTGVSAVIPLPPELATEQGKADLLATVSEAYNTGETEPLLQVFGAAYRLDLIELGADERIAALRSFAATIGEGAYKRYEAEDLGNGLVQYRLLYKIDTPGGIRTLEIGFTRQGADPYQINSINISTSD